MVLLVSIAFVAIVAAGLRVPGADLARTIAGKLVCAVGLGESCGSEPSALVLEYGPEMAETVVGHVPLLDYEEGMLALPIDYRACREVACAQGVRAGRATETSTGEQVTLFSHVIDCRDPEAPVPPEAECKGVVAGNLYLQYWAYYPDSATAPFGEAGYHPDDWESFQVRIGPESIEERASSHHGYNGRGGNSLNDVIHSASGWTPSTGRYWISSGSHAGRVGEPPGKTTHTLGPPIAAVRINTIQPGPHRWTPSEDVRVIPIESIRGEWGDYVGSPDHKPAWLKDVFYDPEATGTSG